LIAKNSIAVGVAICFGVTACGREESRNNGLARACSQPGE